MGLNRLLATLLALLLATPSAVADYKPASPVLLEEKIISSNQATVDFTTRIDSTYKYYVIEYWNVVPSVDGSSMFLLVGTGCPGSCSWITTNTYADTSQTTQSDGNEYYQGNWDAAQIALQNTNTAQDCGNASNESASGWIKIYNPADTSTNTRMIFYGTYTDLNGHFAVVNGGGAWMSNSAVSGIRLDFNSSADLKGNFRLYGYR